MYHKDGWFIHVHVCIVHCVIAMISVMDSVFIDICIRLLSVIVVVVVAISQFICTCRYNGLTIRFFKYSRLRHNFITFAIY